jgi:hypothetical protein
MKDPLINPAIKMIINNSFSGYPSTFVEHTNWVVERDG